MIDFERHTEWAARATAERDLAANERTRLMGAIEVARADAAATERAREVANAVLLLTQGQVKSYVEEVVTLALSTVYPGYAFELEYSIKRNQSEATPWIVRGGERMSPREEVGGGVLDIASLGLRWALWSLADPKPARIFVLDEPAKFISRDKQAAFGQMLREVSKLLGVQILLVSHSTDIIEQADKAYEVSQKKGVSEVRAV